MNLIPKPAPADYVVLAKQLGSGELTVPLHRLTNKLMEFYGYNRNCANCEQFSHEQDICTRFNVKPPTKVIVKGCEYWDEAIPF